MTFSLPFNYRLPALNLRYLERWSFGRPTIPLATALVAIILLGRMAGDIVGSIDLGESFSRQHIVGPVATQPTGFDPFDPFEQDFLAIEPAAGPQAASFGTQSIGTGVPDNREFMSVEGLEDVANELVERRRNIEAREAELRILEQALSAKRMDIEGEIQRLEQLRDDIASMVQEVDEEEERRLRQLVKVYETMKAKRAAAIFDRLEMPVLMPVAKRMRETKLASIMAAMDPGKAKIVTSLLARETTLPGLE